MIKANGTKPVSGLEKTLKVEVSARPKNKTLDFDPDDDNPAHYTATFFPSAQTTCTYTITGTINNTPVHIGYTCIPGAGDDTPGSNTKVTLSNGVVRDGTAGGFPYPLPRPMLQFHRMNLDTTSMIHLPFFTKDQQIIIV